LLVSVVLPATIVAADSLALSHAQSQSWSTEATLVVFGLFLAQVALMGHFAGRYLPNSTAVFHRPHADLDGRRHHDRRGRQTSGLIVGARPRLARMGSQCH